MPDCDNARDSSNTFIKSGTERCGSTTGDSVSLRTSSALSTVSGSMADGPALLEAAPLPGNVAAGTAVDSLPKSSFSSAKVASSSKRTDLLNFFFLDGPAGGGSLASAVRLVR